MKTIGKKIFGEGDPDPGAKIKAEIEKDNPGLKDLAVKFENGIVELTGSGPVEAPQKAILMAGNVMGVGEVKVAGVAPTSVEDGTQYYLIKSGDTRRRSPSSSMEMPTSIRRSSKPIARSSRTRT